MRILITATCPYVHFPPVLIGSGFSASIWAAQLHFPFTIPHFLAIVSLFIICSGHYSPHCLIHLVFCLFLVFYCQCIIQLECFTLFSLPSPLFFPIVISPNHSQHISTPSHVTSPHSFRHDPRYQCIPHMCHPYPWIAQPNYPPNTFSANLASKSINVCVLVKTSFHFFQHPMPCDVALTIAVGVFVIPNSNDFVLKINY